MELITMLYVDDKIDLYVSKYLNSYSNDKAEYKYSELNSPTLAQQITTSFTKATSKFKACITSCTVVLFHDI